MRAGADMFRLARVDTNVYDLVEVGTKPLGFGSESQSLLTLGSGLCERGRRRGHARRPSRAHGTP